MTSYDLIKTAIPMFVPAEIDELKRLANTLPRDPTVVIIGAGVGVSSIAILEERPDALIFSIDSMFPTKQAMYKPGERANLIEAGLWETGSVIQVWGESQIVGKRWPIKSDLLFIDGDHRYPAVKEDIRLWLPYAKSGSVIAFHDYANKRVKPKAGVKQAVDEEVIGWCWLISHVHHLIVFRAE